jgi:hypothetical protein
MYRTYLETEAMQVFLGCEKKKEKKEEGSTGCNS